MDGILEVENRFIHTVAELQIPKEGYKTYVYGDGLGGKRVRGLLVLYGISFDGTVVDRRYWEKDSGSLCLEEVMEKTDKPVNLIVAFRGYLPGSMLDYGEKLNAVVDMDCWTGEVDIEDKAKWTYEWVEENAGLFGMLQDALCDSLSHRTLFAWLNQKISWDYRYLEEVRQPFQYFDTEINKMSEREVFLDCGAYDGDSAVEFIRALKRRGYDTYDEIISFEPDPDNYRKLKERNLKNHTCIPKGVSNGRKMLRFSGDNRSSRCAENGELSVEVDSIDNVMNGRRVTMIKMDIEGGELDALAGAKETIQKYKPLLAICVYHKREDLLTIPQYIKSLVPEYRLFLRAYDRTATELVLYAVL